MCHALTTAYSIKWYINSLQILPGEMENFFFVDTLWNEEFIYKLNNIMTGLYYWQNKET